MAETYATIQEVVDAYTAFADLPAARQQALIEAASQAVSDYCGRRVTQQVQVETHSGANGSRVYLRVTPVASVSEVVVNGTSLDNAGGDAWSFDPRTGALLRGSGVWGDPRFNPWFPSGFGNMTVTYVGGFNQLPAAIKEATIQAVIALASAPSVLSGDIKSESLGDWSYTQADAPSGALPAAAMDLLGRYRSDPFW